MAGTVELTGSASWTQEAGSDSQSGNPVQIFGSGTLTDVSGAGSFDLIDSPTLTGTIPAGQTVTADAIHGHNATIEVSGVVTNNGTLALLSPVGGGQPNIAGGTQIDNKGLFTSQTESLNYLEANLLNTGTVEVKSGELRQDNNTTTTNEGSFKVLSGAIFHALTGSDLFVNKGSVSNAGTVELTGSASWTQEAGSDSQSGNPVQIFGSGTLTDVSGAGSFDLIDSPTLTGTIPAGQTVTADAIKSHSATIEIPATVTNEGTLALVSPAEGGYTNLHETTGSSKVVNDGLITAQSESSVNYLEVPLVTPRRRHGGSKEWRTASGRQHDDHQRRLVQGFGWRDISAEHRWRSVCKQGFCVATRGRLSLKGNASWTQEAGVAPQSGNPVSIYGSGTLTDVSGAGNFDSDRQPQPDRNDPGGTDGNGRCDSRPQLHFDLTGVSGEVINQGTFILDNPSLGAEPP